MRKILIISSLLLMHSITFGQVQNYYFSVRTDTLIEQDDSAVVAFIKTDSLFHSQDSISVYRISAAPRSSHMDTTAVFNFIFSAGVDSVPFYLKITKDTFPEYPENVVYVLRSMNGYSLLSSDSLLTFVLEDTTPPAIITFVHDSDWAWSDYDTFISGTHYTGNLPVGVGIRINNPNPFYVRYFAYSFDCWHNVAYPFVNACVYTDFYFNGETCYAPPGISTYMKSAYIVTQDNSNPKYFVAKLGNIDANIIVDSLDIFTIKPVNFYSPPQISFDTPSLHLFGDTNLLIGLPVTIHNSNRRPLYFSVDTMQTMRQFPGTDFTFANASFGFGYGTSHDTVWVQLLNRNLINDTIRTTFVIRPDSLNTMGDTLNLSADTLFNLIIADTGSLQISFLGAGYSYLKSDSIGYFKVLTNAPSLFPVSVKVSTLAGSAIADTDYYFSDTTVTFPAFVSDTIVLPVVMLQDHIHSGNTQINFQLSNVNPASVSYRISQFTYTIIDDEDSNLAPYAITNIVEQSVAVIYPNPTSGVLNISTHLKDYSISVEDILGEEVFSAGSFSDDHELNFTALPSGIYSIKIFDKNEFTTFKLIKY